MARHDARAGGDLKNEPRGQRRDPVHDVYRVRLKDERNQMRFVKRRNCAVEDLVAAGMAHIVA